MYDFGDAAKPPILLFSNPASMRREKMTVQLSYDQGKTWPVAKQLSGRLSPIRV